MEHLLASAPAVIYAFKARDDFRPTFISSNIKDLLGYEREEYLTPGMICEDPMIVRREVERRRANGGVLRRIAPPPRLLAIFARYEL